jgi:translation elongation factor EF-Ts
VNYYFKIEEGSLVYYKDDSLKDEVGRIYLNGRITYKSKEIKNAFILKTNSEHLFKAKNEEETNLWVETLKEACKNDAVNLNKAGI